MASRKLRRKLSKPAKKSPLRKSPSKGKRSSKIGRDFEKLVAVMARLRAPGGCPWDREQTHATLRTYLIEEAYEVLDALDSTDDAKFAEELGDLLLQVLFHAQIAHEEKRFAITDVIRAIHDKMVRRHPHVFGTTTAKTAADVLRNWEIIKKEERAKSAAKATQKAPESYLDGVPRTLPALLEALQLTRKAARIGFDWANIDGIFAKLTEETHELQGALSAGVAAGLQTRQGESTAAISPENSLPADASLHSGRIEGELGDILFVAVNLARFLHIDPELALKKTSAKFTRRFHRMEQFARDQGTTLAQIPRDQLESFWDRSKLLD
jgi:MazG family protein